MDHTNQESHQFVEESFPVTTGYPIYGQTPVQMNYPVQSQPYYPNYGYPAQNVPVQEQSNNMLNNYLPQIKGKLLSVCLIQ